MSENMEGEKKDKTVSVEIQGKTYQVPEGISILQAYWSIGEELIHGVGCLGGVCGACTVTFRFGSPPQARTGLACQIPVKEGMSFNLFPIEIQRKGKYQLGGFEHPGSELLRIYPETKRCVSCHACTNACPQEINVMDGVLNAIRGNLEPVSESFYNCVMCGLCAVVCDVGIKPHWVGLYSRRVMGQKNKGRDVRLQKRIQEIERRLFDPEWQRVQSLDEKELVEYAARGEAKGSC